MRLVQNITSSIRWFGSAVGIIRVETELTRYLASRYDVTHVCLDQDNQRFSVIPPQLVQNILADASPEHSEVEQATAERAAYLKEAKAFTSDRDDTFVSLGSDWSFQVPRLLAEMYDKPQAVFACYDSIPLIYPEKTPDPYFENQFKRHYVDMAHTARGVFAISQHSKNDLLAFWKRADIATTTPHVEAIPLASLPPSKPSARLSADDQATLESVDGDRGFVLYVSSIEPRKNHELLLHIWRDLCRARGKAMPTLVFVGRKGWGSESLLAQMQRMLAFRARKIIWLSDLGDALLSQLYARCQFSLFPSIYEGWGLGVSEAMSFGKVCAVANTSSLEEAAQGLMPALHPLDYPEWRQLVARLIDDSRYREQLEADIASKYRQRNWAQVGRDFCDTLLDNNI